MTQKGSRILIWDWNGTLLDDVQAACEALNRMLAMRKLKTLSLDEYRTAFDFPVRPLYTQLGMDLAHEDWNRICHDYHAFYHASTLKTLHPKTRQALERAQANGMRQFVLSAMREDILQREIADRGIASFFEGIIGTDNLDGCSKLDRGRALISRLRQADATCTITLIGDTRHDAEVAEALGCACILVSCGYQNAERLARLNHRLCAGVGEAVACILSSASRASAKPSAQMRGPRDEATRT